MMADELLLDQLERQQKILEQKMQLEIHKREASEMKLQSQIDGFKSNLQGMKSNFQQQMKGMNEKFDHIDEVLVCIQLQILKLQSRSQKFTIPQNLPKNPFLTPEPVSLAKKKLTLEALTHSQLAPIITSNLDLKFSSSPESHPIFHDSHEENIEAEGVLMENPTGVSKKEIEPQIIQIEASLGNEVQTEELPAFVGDQSRDPTNTPAGATKESKILDKDLENKSTEEFSIATTNQNTSHLKLVLIDPLEQQLYLNLNRVDFSVLDLNYDREENFVATYTKAKHYGGREEAWSRGLPKKGRAYDWSRRPPKHVGRRISWSRRTTKERSWSFLAGFSTTTNEKGKGTRSRGCRPLSYENHQNSGREKARICRIPMSNGRSDAWSRRISPRYDGRRRRSEHCRISDGGKENDRSFENRRRLAMGYDYFGGPSTVSVAYTWSRELLGGVMAGDRS